MREDKYALRGAISSDVRDDSSDVHCVSASLSVQDFDNVGGASGLEGFRRTAPRCPKCERPRSANGADESSSAEIAVLPFVWEDELKIVGAGLVQGEASSCASMISSILASPHGASEQYIWICTSSLSWNGWDPVSRLDCSGRRSRN
jgi:hypothetical protein